MLMKRLFLITTCLIILFAEIKAQTADTARYIKTPSGYLMVNQVPKCASLISVNHYHNPHHLPDGARPGT
jgi:hypothetical protein